MRTLACSSWDTTSQDRNLPGVGPHEHGEGWEDAWDSFHQLVLNSYTQVKTTS